MKAKDITAGTCFLVLDGGNETVVVTAIEDARSYLKPPPNTSTEIDTAPIPSVEVLVEFANKRGREYLRWADPYTEVDVKMPDDPSIYISTATDLAVLSDRLGVRPDWHEPDNQSITARVIGDHLDNAMGPADAANNFGEYNILLDRDGTTVGVINIADLLAWASEAGDS